MGNAELTLARHRISQYQWFARRYREGAASAARIARFYEKEAVRLEERLARD